MAIMRFSGVVRGYQVDEKNEIRLTIEDTSPSQSARDYVSDVARRFDPKAREHGFGARDKECVYRPGFAPYVFTVSKEMAGSVTIGSIVDVEVDVYHVRRVFFGNNRWFPKAELRYDLCSLSPFVAGSSAASSSVGAGHSDKGKAGK